MVGERCNGVPTRPSFTCSVADAHTISTGVPSKMADVTCQCGRLHDFRRRRRQPLTTGTPLPLPPMTSHPVTPSLGMVALTLTVLSLCCCCCHLANAQQTSSASSDITHINVSHDLEKMAVDATGHVYAGAVNALYKLKPDLSRVLQEEMTGPILDSPSCEIPFVDAETRCGMLEKKMTDTHNKVLVVDTANAMLLTCGSVRQGTCQLRQLSNISRKQDYAHSQDHYLAANDATSSTVAFIAPGPPDPARVKVIYSATTYTGPNLIRSKVPIVAMRQLSGGNALSFVKFNPFEDSGSFLTMSEDFLDYNITYVGGFHVDGFNYFLSVQRQINQSTSQLGAYVSKIIRVCDNDDTLATYVEVELKCGRYGLLQAAAVSSPGQTLAMQMRIRTTDKVLVAAFTERVSRTNPAPKTQQPSTVVCVYSFKDINAAFVDNIRECFKGEQGQSSIVKHVNTKNKACRRREWNIDGNFCVTRKSSATIAPLNHHIEGHRPISAIPVINITRLVTAIAVSSIENHTIAFLGTSQGHLKKLVLLMDGAGTNEYADMPIHPGHSILPDMRFDPDEAHLYMMTKRQIFKVAVSNCQRYTNCSSCALTSSDPYCGWCSLERKCVHKKQCVNSNRSNYWLSYKSWACVKISSLLPDHASVYTQVPVRISIDQRPEGDRNQFACKFGGVEVNVESVDMNSITCITPPPNSDIQPQFASEEQQDHVNVTLEVFSLQSGIAFVEKSFSFYNCSIHDSCTMCTMSKWGCRWCIKGNRCQASTDSCPSNENPVLQTSRCPQLLVPSQPILIPVDFRMEIRLQGRNMPKPEPGQEGYRCVFHIKSPPDVVPARYVDSQNVVCEAKEYSYIPPVSEKKGKVDLMWGPNYYIDDENDVEVTFYKCHIMGEDCSLCISLVQTMSQYNCRWCGSRGCLYGGICEGHHSSTCPSPKLHGVFPLTGPLGGGTLVNISGSNLGSTFKEVRDGVTVAGRPCTAVESEYRTARNIVCNTTNVTMPTSGPIIVRIGDVNATYVKDFFYQDPQLTGLHPKRGPMAGGTEVTITGQVLNTGIQINASLDSLPCTINKEVMETQITCLTSAVHKPRTTNKVTVTFDGHMKFLTEDATFNYTLNPNISSIEPRTSYMSGGRLLTVTGQYFDVIQAPGIFLISGDFQSDVVRCNRTNETLIHCLTPDVTSLLRRGGRTRRQAIYDLYVGFRMDGVEEVRNLAKYMPWVNPVMMVHPDPLISNFTDGKSLYSGGALVIKGEGMDGASTMNEVKVHIGNKECTIETVSSTKLVCKPPDQEPDSENGRGHLVVVVIGNRRYVLGHLEYQENLTHLPTDHAVGIGVTGGILVLIIIIILIVYQAKSTEAERQFRKMQMQLDTLESNVRNECKQAFAELQTEVTDLTSDLNVTGIPFWDYKTYTFKVLFPSHTDHPVLHNKLDQMHNSTMKRPAGQELGLQQFNQLLNSRQFLITFIRTLEGQKNFSIRDKAVVASLLMIVLQDKMEYATEILKALLNELIDKSVEKKHPKLMLRRTESVVEKFLTNWLSICMYSYLKKHAGKSMFLLYKAIKHQTEKGPVDAITSEARYSLSEDRLLREKIEPKTLTINLVVEHEPEMVTCKVLDCDTITQAKEKCLNAIYMNTPCTRRPAVYDVDLEWRSGRSGHLPLQDEDVTTQMVSGWKRINTLAHYHVPDGAIMAISPTRNKNDMIRHAHGMVEITAGSPFSNIKPIVTVEEGHKVWHLVKHDDSQNQSRTQKVISEIFLTRLLSTKGTLQQFIDDLFLMILKVDSSVPPAIKYLFDFLDQAARRHNIVDQEVVHTWKSNSLPLRFWVNLIKNPEFVFDIRKSNIVDSCLSVIAQTFMDSCSTMEHRLGKDSPSNKLLFARDIPKYRKWVEKFYKDVQEMPPVSDREMNEAMMELSTRNVLDFNVPCALKELYRYAMQYNIELLEALDDDPSARKLRLSDRFEQVSAVMEDTPLF